MGDEVEAGTVVTRLGDWGNEFLVRVSKGCPLGAN